MQVDARYYRDHTIHRNVISRRGEFQRLLCYLNACRTMPVKKDLMQAVTVQDPAADQRRKKDASG